MELVKAAATTFFATVRNHSLTQPQPKSHDRSEGSPYRHPRPTRAIQSNQRFRHRVYICSVINGSGLLGMNILEKHQRRILLDKDKLILNGTIELTLGRERPSLGSRIVNTKGTETQKSSSAEKLLNELGDISEEVKSFLIKNEDIFALEGRPTSRSSVDTGDAKPVALRPRRTPVKYQEFAREETISLLRNKIIRPSSSSWR
ncbi:unnamed protein product [Hymenolepis diminuta]|uniref:Uncharacterized protein n=1 Tax=Hymenolepis diminuta TaxID=6216 RepID=A0A564YUA2_HYMDI|nr:unnamed protein product [Hymenolepis diminuta]